MGTLHFLEVCESAKADAAVLLAAQVTYCCLFAVSAPQPQLTESRKEVWIYDFQNKQKDQQVKDFFFLFFVFLWLSVRVSLRAL